MNAPGDFNFQIGGYKMHMGGPWQFQVAVMVVVIAGSAWSIVWILRDSELRGKSGLLAVLFLFTGWPLSILWWLWLRPPIVKFKFKQPAKPLS